MTELTAQDFSMYSGDTKVLTVTVKTAAEVVVDLTGYTVKWKAVLSGLDTPLEKDNGGAGGVVITNAVSGIFEVTIDPADTSEVNGAFKYEAEITSGVGVVSTVAIGTMTVSLDLIE